MQYHFNNLFLVVSFALVASAVCFGSLLPAHWLPPIKNDKLAHFVAFGTLTFLAQLAAENSLEFLIWGCSLALAGLVIELAQKFVPGRNFCWKDVAANLAGMSFAIIIYAILGL
ncbi:MAG: VanZ family protein [Undibacterium sp.]|nr:VanZ family protein [Undibacterium sp.]